MIQQIIPISLDDIESVKFFKRDELTTDLICCEVASKGSSWIYHEEMKQWDQLITELQRLPDFSRNWFERVSQPPFAASEFIAFQRIAA